MNDPNDASGAVVTVQMTISESSVLKGELANVFTAVNRFFMKVKRARDAGELDAAERIRIKAAATFSNCSMSFLMIVAAIEPHGKIGDPVKKEEPKS